MSEKSADEASTPASGARRSLVRFLVKRDIERHQDIYDELARE
jgi:ribosomal protein S15P/S13E